MQIQRKLDDRPVTAGDTLFDVKGLPVEFVEYKNGDLVVLDSDGHRIRFKPEELACYTLNANRTDRGLAKERLRSFWDN
jgi:hypothetical protein